MSRIKLSYLLYPPSQYLFRYFSIFGVFGLLPFAIMLIVLLKKSIKILILQKYNHKIIHSLFITNIMFFTSKFRSILKSYLGFYAFTLIALSIYVFNMKEKVNDYFLFYF